LTRHCRGARNGSIRFGPGRERRFEEAVRVGGRLLAAARVGPAAEDALDHREQRHNVVGAQVGADAAGRDPVSQRFREDREAAVGEAPEAGFAVGLGAQEADQPSERDIVVSAITAAAIPRYLLRVPVGDARSPGSA
jgi:hypothetical protein